MKNTSFTRHNKLKRETELHSIFSEPGGDGNDLQDAEVSVPLSRDHFVVMVDDLSVEEQLIVSLRFVSELSSAEISEFMNLGLSATKLRFYRALEKLKDSL